MGITISKIRKSSRLKIIHNEILGFAKNNNMTVKQIKSKKKFDNRASLNTIQEIIQVSDAFRVEDGNVITVRGYYYANITFAYTGNASTIIVGGIIRSANATIAHGAQIDNNSFEVAPLEGSGDWTFETKKIKVIIGDFTKPDKYSGNDPSATLYLKPKN